MEGFARCISITTCWIFLSSYYVECSKLFPYFFYSNKLLSCQLIHEHIPYRCHHNGWCNLLLHFNWIFEISHVHNNVNLLKKILNHLRNSSISAPKLFHFNTDYRREYFQNSSSEKINFEILVFKCYFSDILKLNTFLPACKRDLKCFGFIKLIWKIIN